MKELLSAQHSAIFCSHSFDRDRGKKPSFSIHNDKINSHSYR